MRLALVATERESVAHSIALQGSRLCPPDQSVPEANRAQCSRHKVPRNRVRHLSLQCTNALVPSPKCADLRPRAFTFLIADVYRAQKEKTAYRRSRAEAVALKRRGRHEDFRYRVREEMKPVNQSKTLPGLCRHVPDVKATLSIGMEVAKRAISDSATQADHRMRYAAGLKCDDGSATIERMLKLNDNVPFQTI